MNQDLNALINGLEKRSITADIIKEEKVRSGLTFMEEQGSLFEESINAGNEIATLLARLPIFPAIRRKNQKELLDDEGGLPFKTVFGWGRRTGLLVDMEDEDRLFALMRLRTKKLKGKGHKLPCPIENNSECEVHYLETTLNEINNELGLQKSGQAREMTLKSLKRLTSVQVEINTNKQSRYFGKGQVGNSLRLLDISWEVYDLDGLIRVQFSPIISKWLETERTFIDWDQRKKLNSRNQKALHRYLSTQPKGKEHSKRLDLVADIIGWEGERRRMKAGFIRLLDSLVEVGFLKSYELQQPRKRMPIVLTAVMA